MEPIHVVSFSGGKDSTAMLLMMIERNMSIDLVLCADTGMEFPEMYEHLDKMDALLHRERGIGITYLRHPKGFEYLMFNVPQQQERAIARRIEKGQALTGYGWPSMMVRWCTGQLKAHPMDSTVNTLKGQHSISRYIGIAADEQKRIKKEKYPLVEWGVSEADALQYCYKHGFNWSGLYEIYHRCSCWCCPLQRIGELRKLRQHHPELWQRLRDMDNLARKQFGPGPLGQFKERWSVEALEERFAVEEQQISITEVPL